LPNSTADGGARLRRRGVGKAREDRPLKRIDIVTACVMLALSGLVLVETGDLAYWAEFAPGSAFAPIWVAGAGIVLALALLVSALRGGDDVRADLPDRSGLARVLATLAGLWLVIVATPLLGLLTAATLFVAFLLLLVLRRPVLPSLLATAMTIALVAGVFVGWLNVSLPKGPFGI
jgi:putative tricarboxylic transport membrane protein